MQVVRVTKATAGRANRLAAKLLRAGKTIIFPTDTIYGILADATNRQACRRIFRIKRRPRGKAFPILVSSLKAAERYARVSAKARIFLKKIWPGPVTVILPYRGGLAPEATSRGAVALRVPKQRAAQEFLKKTGCPLAATSANLSGKPYRSDPAAIVRAFKKADCYPDYFFNFGKLPRRKPSAIIDLRGKIPKRVR